MDENKESPLEPTLLVISEQLLIQVSSIHSRLGSKFARVPTEPPMGESTAPQIPNVLIEIKQNLEGVIKALDDLSEFLEYKVISKIC